MSLKNIRMKFITTTKDKFCNKQQHQQIPGNRRCKNGRQVPGLHDITVA